MTAPDVPPARERRPARVGLEAVALEAGVSVATASRALSGRPVRPELRQRVESVAELLGYRPDLARQAVARGETRTVVLIVDYLRSPFGVEITRGVVDAAARHGLVVSVTGGETHPGDLLEMIASARALRPRSLVLATGLVQDTAIRGELIRSLNAYEASGGTVAIVDGLDLPFASCAFDEVTAAHALCRSLVHMGYRRPIVFNSSAERSDLTSRTEALIEGFVLAGLSREEIRLVELPTTVSSEVADEDLLRSENADVILCVEGAVIPAVYRHIRSRGLHVGIDVAVTAFGQYGIANALRPHLTTVELPLRSAGELALDHALNDSNGAHLSLPGNLRLRASSPRRSDTRQDAAHIRVERPAKAKRIGSVAIVTPTLTAPELGAIASELFTVAARGDRRWALLSEDSFLEAASDRQPDGDFDALIVCGPLSPTLNARVRGGDLACVVVDAPTDAPVTHLAIEVAEGMQKLLEHLHSLGHGEILYIPGDGNDPVEKQRQAGIDLFTATHEGVTVSAVDPEWLPSMLGRDVTAIVAHDDLAAARITRDLIESGRDVPGDVSVAGFGGTWASELSTPSITTVRLDAAAIAAAAWRLIDQETVTEVRSLSTTLVRRDSTGTARTL